MKWKKHDDYALVSEDGRYSISKISDGKETYYEANRRRAHENGAGLCDWPQGHRGKATRIPDWKTARVICERDDAER